MWQSAADLSQYDLTKFSPGSGVAEAPPHPARMRASIRPASPYRRVTPQRKGSRGPNTGTSIGSRPIYAADKQEASTLPAKTAIPHERVKHLNACVDTFDTTMEHS